MARNTWVDVLSNFVRKNPRTSAMIAFNLGVWAAQATRKGIGGADLTKLPSKLVELVPSMKDLESYIPALPSPGKRQPARKHVARKRAAKRPVRRRASRSPA